MGMVTGADYLKRMKLLKSDVWMDGEQVKGSYVDHPAFKPVLNAKAQLYDMVHDEKYATILQSKDKESNFSFEIPRSMEDLKKRRKATQLWANETLGVLGRSPEYVNTMITIMAGAKDFFLQAMIRFTVRIWKIYTKKQRKKT